MGRPQPLAVIGLFVEPAGTDPGPEAVAVATELRWPGHQVPCPSAALLAGALRRQGLAVMFGPMTVGGGCDAAAVLHGVRAPVPEPDQPAVAVGYRVGHDHLANEIRAVVGLWRRAAGPRTVLLASPRSFCAGVERAIDVVERALAERGRPAYVRKQIVHNTHVVNDLRDKGAVFVDELDEVPDGATVIFSAHGVSPAVRQEAHDRGLDVIDTTCPMVAKVHSEARRYAARGDTIVLIGHAGHDEIEGTLGEAPDRIVLVETVADIDALEVADPARVSYLTQTTLALDETADAVAALRQRYPDLRGPDSEDICYASTNRQAAVSAVAAEADLVLVVGSANSSNSVRMVELCRRQGVPAHLVEDAGHIDLAWLVNAATIGLTAGASAPAALVDDVIAALRGLGPVAVEVREVATETVQFALPRKVRRP
jgi:4-hydroxy-3-methylbut-2-en-1-yl diphosphate reductase